MRCRRTSVGVHKNLYTLLYLLTLALLLNTEDKSRSLLDDFHKNGIFLDDHHVSRNEHAPTLQKNRKSVCFVTTSYANSPKLTDQLVDMSGASNRFRYYLFTNFHDNQWKTPGWQKITTQFLYRRRITHSRYGKFLSWKYKEIRANCQAVFYMDSSNLPVMNDTLWTNLATTISQMEPGLMQMQHPTNNRSGIFSELYDIIAAQKDYRLNIEKTIRWLKRQPDYEEATTIYLNQLFGYDPCSPIYQRVSNAFWEHYSLELDSWRDQPLWAFMLHRYNVSPIPFPVSKDELWTSPKSRYGQR